MFLLMLLIMLIYLCMLLCFYLYFFMNGIPIWFFCQSTCFVQMLLTDLKLYWIMEQTICLSLAALFSLPLNITWHLPRLRSIVSNWKCHLMNIVDLNQWKCGSNTRIMDLINSEPCSWLIGNVISDHTSKKCICVLEAAKKVLLWKSV